jgi:lipopolysaccharide transport system permease protein
VAGKQQVGATRDVGQANGRVLVIARSRGWRFLSLGELWRYRELLYFLTWRDVKVRYKQTVIGAAWAILQPVLTMVVFSLFFGRLAGIPSEGIPYPIFSYCGLLPWTLFAQGMGQASASLVNSSGLVTKVYFPRLIIPLSAVLVGVVDFALAFLVLLGLMVYYGIYPGVSIVWLPAFLTLALVTSLGAGLWLSALNVQYRDVRYTVPFLTQIWLFATPVIYPSTLLHGPWRVLLGLNPMTAVVEGFRWSLLRVGSPPTGMFSASFAAAFLLLVSGALYFRRVERVFADVV